MIEQIKSIEGFSRYFISNFGHTICVREGNVMVLRPYVVGRGYLRVTLFGDDDKRKDKLVHRLVAEAEL